MNVFVPDNAKVRVFIDTHGNVMTGENNVFPTLQVEVVVVPDGKAICHMQDELPDSLPFGAVMSVVK